MKIIVGLGNPGEKYKNTRHNIGFIILDRLDLDWQEKKKMKAQIAIKNDAIYVKPLTYMNSSGQAVYKVLDYYKLIPKKLGCFPRKNYDLSNTLTVIHDDIDIQLGQIKKSLSRGSAGHKGIQSIIDHLKTNHFTRLRIGIKGEKSEQIPTPKYVLSRFKPEELEIILAKIKDEQINT